MSLFVFFGVLLFNIAIGSTLVSLGVNLSVFLPPLMELCFFGSCPFIICYCSVMAPLKYVRAFVISLATMVSIYWVRFRSMGLFCDPLNLETTSVLTDTLGNLAASVRIYVSIKVLSYCFSKFQHPGSNILASCFKDLDLDPAGVAALTTQ